MASLILQGTSQPGLYNSPYIFVLQVVVRNVPYTSGRSVSDSIDHFFQTNHPDHYLCHQVVQFQFVKFVLIFCFIIFVNR